MKNKTLIVDVSIKNKSEVRMSVHVLAIVTDSRGAQGGENNKRAHFDEA